jgi:hypothetical protein
MKRTLEITIEFEDANGRCSFEVTAEGQEYAKGSCGELSRAAQQATHYAFMDLSDPASYWLAPAAESGPNKERV